MLKKSHSRARTSAVIAADGTSIIIPIGMLRSKGHSGPVRAPDRTSSMSPFAPRSSSMRRDHRQQQAHVAERARAQDRAQLRVGSAPGFARLSRIERQPSCGFSSSSRPMFGMSLSPPRSRVRIVTMRGARCFDDALVELLLLLFAGKAAMGEREHLGAEQADALGAVLVDEPQIAQQTGVGRQRMLPPVERLGGALAQRVEVLDRDRVALCCARWYSSSQTVVGREVDHARSRRRRSPSRPGEPPPGCPRHRSRPGSRACGRRWRRATSDRRAPTRSPPSCPPRAARRWLGSMLSAPRSRPR